MNDLLHRNEAFTHYRSANIYVHHPGGDDAPFTPVTMHHSCGQRARFAAAYSLELPPDWDKEEKMWKTGELFKHYGDWKIHKIDEVIFEDLSGGSKHFHCMDTLLAEKRLQRR